MKQTLKTIRNAVVLTGSLLTGSLLIQAQDTWLLHNHPDGAAAKPYYGLRLDGLYTGNSSDIFTFDFDFSSTSFQSEVKLTYDGSTIHISGYALGGKDSGSDNKYDGYVGVYQIDFTYEKGISLVDPDFGLEVKEDNKNRGTITRVARYDYATDTVTKIYDPKAVKLEDYAGNFGYSFRFNDFDTHRVTPEGHTPEYDFEGYGWLNHSGESHIASSDWLFTGEKVTPPIPEPSEYATIAALGLIGFVAWRRKAKEVTA